MPAAENDYSIINWAVYDRKPKLYLPLLSINNTYYNIHTAVGIIRVRIIRISGGAPIRSNRRPLAAPSLRETAAPGTCRRNARD